MSGRRRGGGEDHGGGGHGGGTSRWLVSYADFITLMMVFFIVLWSASRVDSQKYEALKESLSLAFLPSGNLLPVPGPSGAGGLGSGISDTPSGGEENPDGSAGGSGEGGLLSSNLFGIPPTLDQVGAEVADALQGLAGNGEIRVISTDRGLVVSLQNQVLFDSGSSALRPESERILREVAKALREIENDVQVEGFTDDRPIATAQYPSNWELSTARATTVVRFLVEKEGLNPDRFGAVGYGEYRNIYPNDTEADRQKNRRVDIVILRSRPSLNIGREVSGHNQ